MKSVLRWVVANVGLFFLSLLLALLVWVVAVEQDNPTSEERYRSPVPVVFTGLPEGMVFYDPTDTQVYVTLRAPESVWDVLNLDHFYAVVDLSGLEEGEHRLPIEVSVDREPVMIRQVEPEAITIQLERVAQTSALVDVRIAGDTARGYVARHREVTPLTVTVSGPASYVAQVADVVAQVSVEGVRADVEGEFALEPRDVEGAIVPYVDLSPAQVAVRVPVDQMRGFRDLTVSARLEGQVASGYRISSITVDPDVVTVFGSQDELDQIPGYLETIAVNIEGAWENVEERIPLDVPEGVSLIDMDEPLVTVQVFIVPQEGSVTLERRVEVQGWTPGITATVAPTMVQVILSGPLPILERLQEEDVLVVVDLFGLTPGSYSLEPRVIVVPQEVVADSVVPANVQVEIRVEGTPTPGR